MLALSDTRICASSEKSLAAVREVEKFALGQPQLDITTIHAFHAGMYARTIMVPAGAMITGALIKIPTLLILSGDASVIIDGEEVRISGYGVIPAAAGRKQVFLAHSDTYLTMVFATSATTIEEAEMEFTDEFDLLGSRREK